MRGKGKRIVFLFLGGKSESSCSLLGGSRGRSAAIAALGYRHRRANAWAQSRHGTGNPAYMGLIPFPSLSSLYTLDTYVGAQSGRNGWMSVFSSLCIYSISQNLAVVKNGKWKKMEGMEKSGRRGIAGGGD